MRLFRRPMCRACRAICASAKASAVASRPWCNEVLGLLQVRFSATLRRCRRPRVNVKEGSSDGAMMCVQMGHDQTLDFYRPAMGLWKAPDQQNSGNIRPADLLTACWCYTQHSLILSLLHVNRSLTDSIMSTAHRPTLCLTRSNPSDQQVRFSWQVEFANWSAQLHQLNSQLCWMEKKHQCLLLKPLF